MNVLALYIFRKEGLPLLSRFYDENAQKIDGLVAPFLVSTNNRMEELTGSIIEEIALQDNMHLLLESFANIICAVVVSDKKDTTLNLDLVARRFYKRFHRSLGDRGWTGKLDKFEEFVPEMEDLLGIESNVVISSMPTQILDSFVMADFNKQEQVVIRELIKSSEIKENRIYELMNDKELAENFINRIVEEKYVGVKKRKSGEMLYFKIE